MKNYIIPFVFTLMCFYLAGSFISLTFNFTEWDVETRIGIFIIGLVASIFSVMMYDMIEKD